MTAARIEELKKRNTWDIGLAGISALIAAVRVRRSDGLGPLTALAARGSVLRMAIIRHSSG